MQVLMIKVLVMWALAVETHGICADMMMLPELIPTPGGSCWDMMSKRTHGTQSS